MHSGDVIHERYVLEEPLGTGGMAEVWRAQDRRLERLVAIKLPAPTLAEDPEFMVRFFSEAQAVARLSHPNVVQVLDFGEHEGRSFLVMEHVPGGSLLDVETPMDQERAREIIREAALGAGAAHEAGIVHRDIKPGNILIDEEGRAKLADFGIAATAVSERLTATGAAIGSPHYISPEQASGGVATAQSDVYALGVVLYELLTGVRPIDADNLAAIAIAHVEREPQPPTAHVGGIDAALERVVMRCLAKDPARRYSDGLALARALDLSGASTGPAATVPVALPIEEPEPAFAAEEPPPENASRRGLLLAAAGIAALLAIVGVVLLAGRTPDDAVARAPARGPKKPSATVTHRRHKATPSPSATSVTGVGATPLTTPSATPRSNPHARGGNGNGKQKPKPKPNPPKPKPKPKPKPSRSSAAPSAQPSVASSPSP